MKNLDGIGQCMRFRFRVVVVVVRVERGCLIEDGVLGDDRPQLIPIHLRLAFTQGDRSLTAHSLAPRSHQHLHLHQRRHRQGLPRRPALPERRQTRQ
jgi:hypothetical protein